MIYNIETEKYTEIISEKLKSFKRNLFIDILKGMHTEQDNFRIIFFNYYIGNHNSLKRLYDMERMKHMVYDILFNYNVLADVNTDMTSNPIIKESLMNFLGIK